MITQERLKEVLYYHPESGDFVWINPQSTRVKVGDQAGTLSTRGYIVITIDGKKHYAQRLAVLYTTGAFYPEDTDHENGVKHHNWWRNLRPASATQNGLNAKLSAANNSGLKNISWSKRHQKWRVAMQVNEKHRDFGMYAELNSAIEACAQAMLTFHGDFARVR